MRHSLVPFGFVLAPVTTGVTWSSSDDTIAEVDTTDGFAVAAHALGSATLTVTAGSLTADLAV